MSQSHHVRRAIRDLDNKAPAAPETARPDSETEGLSELLAQVRHSALGFLSGVRRLPRSLRVRAGPVSIEVEWEEEHVASVSETPEATTPTGPVETASLEATVATAADYDYLTAPTVGVFYRAPEPEAVPFITEGDSVEVGQQVGIVEVMKLMIPIESDKNGRVIEVLKANAETVEYDDRLFALSAADAA